MIQKTDSETQVQITLISFAAICFDFLKNFLFIWLLTMALLANKIA